MNATAPAPTRTRWPLPAALAAVAVVCAIVWMHRHEPGYEERIAPVKVAGALGKRVVARNFAVTVLPDHLRFARTLHAPDDDPFGDGKPVVLHTSGIWVAVPVQVDALRETGPVSAQLRSRDGLVYPNDPDDRPKQRDLNMVSRFVAPGLTETGYYFFEIPRDRLQGVHAQFFWGSLMPQSNDALVDIDLGIDAARARKILRATPEKMEIRR